MIVQWHYPAYMNFDHGEMSASFTCEADFLQLPRIRQLMADAELFTEWKLSRAFDSTDLLLLIDKEGKQWVIGYLPEDHGLGFERWELIDEANEDRRAQG